MKCVHQFVDYFYPQLFEHCLQLYHYHLQCQHFHPEHCLNFQLGLKMNLQYLCQGAGTQQQQNGADRYHGGAVGRKA